MKIPAWLKSLDEHKWSKPSKATTNLDKREELLDAFAKSNYDDDEISRGLFIFDEVNNNNPLIDLQNEIKTYDKFAWIIVFKLNGVGHSISWHNIDGYSIDNVLISEENRDMQLPYRDDNEDIDLLISILELNNTYPVIEILGQRTKRTPEGTSVYDLIPPGPLSEDTLSRLAFHDHEYVERYDEVFCKKCGRVRYEP